MLLHRRLTLLQHAVNNSTNVSLVLSKHAHCREVLKNSGARYSVFMRYRARLVLCSGSLEVCSLMSVPAQNGNYGLTHVEIQLYSQIRYVPPPW